jgi:hypothetical protein
MKTLGAALVLVILLSSTAGWAGENGFVRVYNYTDTELTVYVQDVDFYGNRSWRALRDVAPHTFLDLPNVPAGTMVGAKEARGKREWTPTRVEYRGRPIFEYSVRPGAR